LEVYLGCSLSFIDRVNDILQHHLRVAIDFFTEKLTVTFQLNVFV